MEVAVRSLWPRHCRPLKTGNASRTQYGHGGTGDRGAMTSGSKALFGPSRVRERGLRGQGTRRRIPPAESVAVPKAGNPSEPSPIRCRLDTLTTLALHPVANASRRFELRS